MRFVCDQMLIRLGRWLRAAGYDTLIINEPLPDASILELARKEERYLVTRDRQFIGRDDLVVHLSNNNVEDCAKELKAKLGLCWVWRPFSRCMLCNTVLVDAGSHAAQAPEGVKAWCQEFLYCETCDRVYWAGSHTTRMLATLKTWDR